MNIRDQLLPRLRQYLPQLVLFGAVWIAMAIAVPAFTGEAAVFSTLSQLPLVGLVALGVAITMIAGELDLSVASMAAFCGVLAIRLADLGLIAALGVVTVIGGVYGCLQGYLIARLRINSMVLTVASLILLQGISWLASGGGSIQLTQFGLSDPLLARWGVLSPSILVAVVVFAAIGVYMSVSRWGREIYAVGGARNEAFAAGVPRLRPLIHAFAISGACAGLAGGLVSLRAASATPDAFSSLLLAAVAAVLVGGVSLYGGRGTVVNVVLGVLIVSTLSASLAISGQPTYVAQLLTGLLLLVVMAFEFTVKRLGATKPKVSRQPEKLVPAL